LYSGGLCEAVSTIPAWQFKWRTANDNSGVVLRAEKRNTFISFAENTSATNCDNVSLLWRQS